MPPRMRVCEKGTNGRAEPKKWVRKVIHQLLGALILLGGLPAILLGQETTGNPVQEIQGQGDFVLTIHESLISLKAREASLKAILAEIGREMRIEIVGNTRPTGSHSRWQLSR